VLDLISVCRSSAMEATMEVHASVYVAVIAGRELPRYLTHSVAVMTTCIPFLRRTLPVMEVTTEAFPAFETS
jgi:hypothetical protein